MSDLDSQIGAEYQALRGELAHLKDCQVRYFWSSVTVTGVLIGLGGRIDAPLPSALPYMAPLLIVLPCWLIFFDKATTITRIVGYTRVLEEIRINLPNPPYRYVGWENALRLMRKESGSRNGPLKHIWSALCHLWSALCAIPLICFLGSHHRYWSINWLTFFLLCVVCLVVAACHTLTPIESGLLDGLSIVTVLVSVHNLALLKKLNRGKYSYDENEEVWRRLLATRAP